MPFSNELTAGDTLLRNNLKLIDSTGKTIIVIGRSPTNGFPQIQFLSPDGTNDAFINNTNTLGDDSASNLGLNGGRYTPADGVERRGRLFLADSADSITLDVIRSADEKGFGGWHHAQHDAAFVGYRDDANNIANFMEIGIAERASFNVPLVHQFPGSKAESWHHVGDTGEPSFFSPWTNIGTGNMDLMFRRGVQNDVQLVGRAKSTSGVGSSTSIFTLPIDYAPTSIVCCPAVCNNPAITALLVIRPSGLVSLNNFVGTVTFNSVDVGMFSFPLGV